MRLIIPATLSAALLAGCVAPPLTEYRPVVDPAKSGARYDADLAACQQIAQQAESEYAQRQQEQLAANVFAGIVVGALAGAAVGGNSDWAAYGAATGAASGVAATDTELAYGGPRRIIDRCMTARGHVVLSDLGAG